MKNVLAFFGAFNPPTKAHVELAKLAMEASGRKGVVFVPSKAEYIVDAQEKNYAFEDELRLEMIKDLQVRHSWLLFSDCDLAAEEQPHTYTSLCALRDQGFNAALLIGEDVLWSMEKEWQDVDKIAREFGIVCITRSDRKYPDAIKENEFLSGIADRITFVEAPSGYHGVSSTLARQYYDQAMEAWDNLCAIVPPEAAALLLKDLVDLITGGSHEA